MPGKWIPPIEVARRRIIQEFALDQSGKGKLVCYGRTFNIEQCDDVLDLAQLVELIMLKLTGKLLRPKFRPSVTDRAALKHSKMFGGGIKLAVTPPIMPAVSKCDVTGHDVLTHYLYVEIEGNVWENYFGRLDELAKCLYIIVREAQGDKYQAKPTAFVGAKGAIVIEQAGNA